MISVIISGHGDFPIALKESSGMIFGEENNLLAVPFLKGKAFKRCKKNIVRRSRTFRKKMKCFF